MIILSLFQTRILHLPVDSLQTHITRTRVNNTENVTNGRTQPVSQVSYIPRQLVQNCQKVSGGALGFDAGDGPLADGVAGQVFVDGGRVFEVRRRLIRQKRLIGLVGNQLGDSLTEQIGNGQSLYVSSLGRLHISLVYETRPTATQELT